MKQVIATHDAPARHWVGDGFPVHGMFGYSGPGVAQRSPFLMLDYAAPFRFEPTTQRRGVGQHPHRGFETVTIVYDGEVEHRDSTGQGGTIGPGDVQWMTAGRGILHEEFHSAGFAARGGEFEMVQLWVNLPKTHKMAEPGYQGITDAQIPSVPLPGDAGTENATMVRSGVLSGAQVLALNPALADSLGGDPFASGVIVGRVQRGSYAHRVGLQGGDIVLTVNGRAVTDVQQLADVGRGSELTINRRGQRISGVIR